MRLFFAVALAIVVTVCGAGQAVAADPPQWMLDAIPSGVLELQNRKIDLANLKRSRTNNPAEKRAMIAEIQALIDTPAPGPMQKTAIGSAGTVFRKEATIVQVVSRDAVLISVGVADKKLIMIQMNTAGMIDDTTVEFAKPIVITGTVSYTTAIGGSNTVLAARLWTEAEKDQFAELVKKYAKKVR